MKAVDKFVERILGISKPWYIEKIEEKNAEKEIHIYLNYKPNSKFKCPVCNKKHSTFDSKWRLWRDLDIQVYKTYIHAKIPRIKCSDKKITINPPWSRDNAHFTLLMEDYMLKLAKISTISKAANLIDEYDMILWRVIHYYVDKCRAKADFSNVVNIGIDETGRKGRRFITNFVNLNTRRVLFVTEGKDHKTVKAFVEDFKAHGGIPENIINVTCDMSKAFIKGIKKNFINAKIIIDKFHVIQLINKALDKVRNEETKENPLLKKQSIYGLKIKRV